MSQLLSFSGEPRWGRALLVLSVVFFLGGANTATSLENNVRIAILEFFFSFFACLLWFSSWSVVRRYSWLALVFLLAGGVVAFANALAVHDGVGAADWWRVFELLAHLFFFVAVFMVLVQSPAVISLVVWGVCFSVLAIFGAIIFIWWGGDPYRYPWVSSPPLFTHIRNMGVFLCAASVILAAAIFIFSGARRYAVWYCYFLTLSILFWSGGRGAIAAAAVGVSLFAFRFSFRFYWRSWILCILAVVLALLASALFDVGERSMGWLNIFGRTLGSDSINQVSSSRMYIWSYVLEFVAERPWFGWGGEAFRGIRHAESLVQPHNSILQLLLEWGGIATFLIMGLYAWLLVSGGLLYLRFRAEADFLMVFGFCLSAALFLLSLVDGVFYHGTSMAFLMIGCAAMGAGIHRARVLNSAGIGKALL